MSAIDDRYVDFQLADWLLMKRRSLGLPQGHVAAAIGVSVAAVSKWESGAYSPQTLALRKAWARALNCRLEITLVNTNGERQSF